MDMTGRENTQGQLEDTLEGLHLPSNMGALEVPLIEAGGNSQENNVSTTLALDEYSNHDFQNYTFGTPRHILGTVCQ